MASKKTKKPKVRATHMLVAIPVDGDIDPKELLEYGTPRIREALHNMCMMAKFAGAKEFPLMAYDAQISVVSSDE